MGTNYSKINCEACFRICGENAILELYHHGELGGRFLCIDCFERYLNNKHYLTKTIKENKNIKIGKCKFCSHKNKNELSDYNFKIHWFGKYDNIIMCQKCLFNKSRRKKK